MMAKEEGRRKKAMFGRNDEDEGAQEEAKRENEFILLIACHISYLLHTTTKPIQSVILLDYTPSPPLLHHIIDIVELFSCGACVSLHSRYNSEEKTSRSCR